MTHLDHARFIASTAAEIKNIHDMGIYDPDEVLDESQMKIAKIGMSKIVSTNKYHPDGSFDKYKSRIAFRGDHWYGLYANKTYAGTVMSETVRLLLSLYGDLPEDHYINMRRPAWLTDTDIPAIKRLRECLYGLPHAPATF